MFYTNIPVLRKQLVGELFLILIIMVLLSKNNMTNKYLLLTIFCMALPWSHYGIAFLFMGMIVFTYTFSSIIITSTVNNNIPYKNLMKKFSFLLVLYRDLISSIKSTLFSVLDCLVMEYNQIINVSLLCKYNKLHC